MLGGVVALHSCDACRFLMHSHLAKSVGMLVVATLLCTLGTDVCASMERVILLVSSVWVGGTLGGNCTLGTCGMAGVCTLGTRCMLGVVESVVVSSKRPAVVVAIDPVVASMVFGIVHDYLSLQ